MFSEKMDNIYRKLEFFKRLFFGLSIAILVASFSTVFWPKVEGQMVEVGKKRISRGSGAVATRYGGGFRGSFTWVSATYEFEVNNKGYTNSIICLCIPIGLQVGSHKDKVEVYYFPLLPKISVIIVGPSIFSSIFLAFFGFALGAFQGAIRNITKT